MLNVSKSSLYEEITIKRDGVEVPLEGKTTNFSYFESIFSPHITASLQYIDTGNSVKASKKVDTQERVGTISKSLPIQGNGKESISFKITNDLGSLDFLSYPLLVYEPIPIFQESNRESYILKMVSEYAVKNENTRFYTKYYNNISSSISDILSKELKIPSDKLSVEQTSNSYAFDVQGQRPFDIIISIASKSVSISGEPGFFFWETQDGFIFRSINSMVSTNPVATYKYYNVGKNSFTDSENNFRILRSPTYLNNSNVLNSLRAGVYRTKNVFFNPFNNEYSEFYLSLSESGLKTLGEVPEYSDEFNNSQYFTRTHNFILDSGNSEIGVSTSINNDERVYLAKSVMRYNLLMTQILDIIVPCNPTLRAGDMILCEFEKTTFASKEEGSIDEYQSGKYLISHLQHNFTPTRSFTSLRLIRDTYGIYTNKVN